MRTIHQLIGSIMKSGSRGRLMSVLLFITSLINVNANQLNYRKVISGNMLSHTSVQCITRDSAGFMWIGTKDGLNRFDGYEYTIYKYNPSNENSISNNEISCITVQGDSLLWIGTRGGGVNSINLRNNEITRYSSDPFDGLVRDVIVDENSGVWIGTNKGLMHLIGAPGSQNAYFKNVSEKATFRMASNESFIPETTHIGVQKIVAFKKNKLLIGAESGIFEYDLISGDFILLSSGLRGLSVTTNISVDSDSIIWVSNYEGLFKLTPKSEEGNYSLTLYNSKAELPNRLKTDWIDDVVIDDDGSVWIALHGEGLALMKEGQIHYFNDSKSNNSILSKVKIFNDVYLDKEKVLWLGSENSGLFSLDLKQSPFKSLLSGNQSFKQDAELQIKAITGKNGIIHVGTITGGIEVFTVNDGELNYTKNIPLISYKGQEWNNEINALLVDRDDNIWIGAASNSLIQYDKQGRFRHYDTNGYIFSLMEDNSGNIWFGTWRQGIGFLNKTTGILEQYNETPVKMMGLSSDKVLSIHESTNGLLLVGTKGGGLNVAPIKTVIDRTQKFTVYEHNPKMDMSISHNDIYNIFQSTSGDIWLGTGRGIVKLVAPSNKSLTEALVNGTVQFQEITEDDGLPGGIVYSISEDKSGYLWLGTNRGLCRYSPDDAVISVFKAADGMAANSFESNAAFFENNSGNMFFGGLSGVTYFNPDSIFTKGKEYHVRFTGMSIQNQPIGAGQMYKGRVVLNEDISFVNAIELNYSDKLISFEFSALNYAATGSIRYAYRLVGFNNDWIETDDRNRVITYTNLSPDSYNLQVKAIKSDGTWPEKSTDILINVRPPFWLTPFAYGLYLLFVLFLLLVFRRYSVIAVEKKNQLAINEIEHRKEVEMSEAKIRFFTNVSHEIRTPLTLIYEPLKKLLSDEELSGSAKELGSMVMRNMKRLLNQVNQLLELRKIDGQAYTLKYSSVGIKELFSKIVYEFEGLIKSKKITVKYTIDEELIVNADRQLLDTVVYNLLSNALKFLPANGELQLEAFSSKEDTSIGDDWVKIKVCDNGPGIPQDELVNIFDYFYQTKEVERSDVGGTGIGLAIVKEYIQLHNGSVQVYNRADGGCCFEIVLPVFKDKSVEAITPHAKTAASNVDNNSMEYVRAVAKDRELKMVLVEDDVDLANYLKSIFSEQFNVSHFSDGQSARENIAEMAPDIIICDLMLPGLNGMDLTAQLKEETTTSHIPIVMLTAKAEDDSKIRGLQYGADSYMTKPFNTDVLIAQVGSILKSRDAFKERFSKQLVLEPQKNKVVTREEKFIQKIMLLTEERLGDSTFEVPDIVKEMGMSHTLLLKKFKAVTGMSLVEFVRSMRIKKAQNLFQQDKFFVADVAYMVGFSDPKYFSKCFTKQIGMSPSAYIKKYHE